MILIFSQMHEQSTDDVMRWLFKADKQVVRINAQDEVKLLSLDLQSGDIWLQVLDQDFNLAEVEMVWHRRGGLPAKLSEAMQLDDPFIEANPDLDPQLQALNARETRTLTAYLYHKLFSEKKSLGDKRKAGVNKLIVLEAARNVGLKIPETHIISTKAQLIDLMEKEDWITKAIWEGAYFFTEKRAYYTYTEKIDQQWLDNLPDTFQPSLLQAQVKKKYELRIFYLHGVCYSMVIFSQNDAQTTVDFRKYNQARPNRNVPYQLPVHIEEKIMRLMHQIGLNTGSIDIIVDQDDEYYFLEVNPVGQFGMTSEPCNYYLEKKVMQCLISN
ncbi:MAG: grasp-with-spasm system ATP-grasp peptide maturase [Bacteroidota bacterium]